MTKRSNPKGRHPTRLKLQTETEETDESPAFDQEVLSAVDAFLVALETFKQDTTSINASSSEAGDEEDDEAQDNLPAECILCQECREGEVDTFIPKQLMEIHRVMVH